MNAILLLSVSEGGGRRTNASRETVERAPDDRYADPGAINGPEVPMTIAFVGLDAAEQQRALASFPGARRCLIAAN
jgi:hypothetical protein